jgi:hypothetical protein
MKGQVSANRNEEGVMESGSIEAKRRSCRVGSTKLGYSLE